MDFSDISLGLVLGLLGSAMSLVSFLMKDMLWLRGVALVSGLLFFVYGLLEWQLPSILLNSVLIPINLKRVLEIRKLTQEMRDADPSMPLSQWLLPHMHKHSLPAGALMFSKGDQADDMFYLQSGTIRLIEIGKCLGPGSLVGEIGLFAPNNKRTLSIQCETDCEFLTLNREEAYRLYYTNPALGFALMRLVVGRLIDLKTPKPPAPLSSGSEAATDPLQTDAIDESAPSTTSAHR